MRVSVTGQGISIVDDSVSSKKFGLAEDFL